MVGCTRYDTISLSAYEMLHRKLFTYRYIRFAALAISIWLHLVAGALDLTSQSFATLHLGQFLRVYARVPIARVNVTSCVATYGISSPLEFPKSRIDL